MLKKFPAQTGFANVPGETMQKARVMKTTIQKQPSSKGITSTLYDARKIDDCAINWEKINWLKERLAEKNNKTPFITCVPPKCDGKKVNTCYGMFQIGSPLSFHLNPIGFTTNIITNIPELCLHLPHMNCLNDFWVLSVRNMVLSQRTGLSLKMKGLFWPLLKLPSRIHMFYNKKL